MDAKPPLPPPILSREDVEKITSGRQRRVRPWSNDVGAPHSVTAVTYSSNGSIVSTRATDETADDAMRKKVRCLRLYTLQSYERI